MDFTARLLQRLILLAQSQGQRPSSLGFPTLTRCRSLTTSPHRNRNRSYVVNYSPLVSVGVGKERQSQGGRSGSSSHASATATDAPLLTTLSSKTRSMTIPTTGDTSSIIMSINKAAPTPTIPIRSVVTSQKVAEIGRGRMEDPKLMTKEEREEFCSLFTQIVRDLTELPEYRDMPDTNRWLAKVLQYNVPHGKRNRGLACALAYRYLAKELTEENVRLSFILGWCVEILQAYLLVADDIMDDSQTRRGRLCWYKVDNIGTAAFNDALLLESCIFQLLKKYFRGKDYYTDLMEIMLDVNYKTIYGQSLDTRTGLEKDLNSYTLDRYSAIVKYKTSFYSFYLPVRLAMAMAGIKDADALQQVRTVTLEMGHFFQVQDDYLDCFGDIEVTGKVGTDIQDCKCSWLFVIASQKATPEQLKILKENYGQADPLKTERVKQLYIELGLRETYNLYEEQTYALICSHINQMSAQIPKQLFFDMVNKIYRRNQ